MLFSANNLKLVVCLFLCLQGSIETSEPVSIRKYIPEPLSLTISLLLPCGICFACCIDDVVVYEIIKKGSPIVWQFPILVSKTAVLNPFIGFPGVDRSALECTYMGQHTVQLSPIFQLFYLA